MKLSTLGLAMLVVLAVTACQKKPEVKPIDEKPIGQIEPPPPTGAPISDPYATGEAPVRSNVTGAIPPPPGKTTVAPTGPTGKTRVTTPAAGGKTHVVKQGETLYKIAKQYYNDGSKWKRIMEANPQLKRPEDLKPGMKLTIP